ncbi:MAG: hypothetical protein HQL46_12680 [Gammaproteobacteria bacterium]|nr:hypothetical protein [Gammaproteobacteria bacterium]
MHAEIIEAELYEPPPINLKSCLEEKYPHVMGKIILFWGYKEFIPFCKKLLVLDKNRDRQGFEFDALQEILFLRTIHQNVFSEFEKKKEIWSEEYLNVHR